MPLQLLHYSDIENAYDDPERIGHLAGLISDLSDEQTIVTGSGDNTAPGVLSLVTQGKQALDFFHSIEPDADVPGNHDFDYGIDPLRSQIRDSPQPWLCANVFAGNERFAAGAGTLSHTVIETANHRVGLIGVATPDTPVMVPEAAPLDFTDPVSAAAESVNELQGCVDALVVLSHCGDDTDLATALDVNVILGGHKHTPHTEHIDGTLVARPGSNGRYLLSVSFEGDGPTVNRHEVTDGPVDEGVSSALRNRMDETGLSNVVATLSEPIPVNDRARLAGESLIGNFVTDALRWRADAEVALMRAGIRENEPLSGSVTAADLIGVLPFDNDLCIVELSGEQLLESFRELAVTYRYPDATDWWFGHVSGATIAWDDQTNSLLEATVNGNHVADDQIYSVAVDSHHVETTHLFSTFGSNEVTSTAGTAYEALVEYAQECGVSPELEGRIQRPAFEDVEGK